MTGKLRPHNTDEYIAAAPAEVRPILEKIRATVKRAAPKAQEAFKYGMPTFTLNGNLVYFAAFKDHIGFYPPVSTEGSPLKDQLAAYQVPKGWFAFPLDKPIPFNLVREIVKLRVKQNLASSKSELK